MIFLRSFLLVGMLAATLLLAGPSTPVDRIKLPDGFTIELLYSVPGDTQGSWVAACLDDKGRMITGDQYGALYRFPLPAPGATLDAATIEQLSYAPPVRNAPAPTEAEKKLPKIGGAHGLLYAFDSLYVVVSEQTGGNAQRGVFRLRDADGDDRFDQLELMQGLDAGGEHGPHSILPTADGKKLFVISGNTTPLPTYTHSRVPELWAEDQLSPSLQHFMRGVEAPRGHVAVMDPDGKTWEIVATGLRNQFDAALNREGELFTFDADMEWDMNTPWYRPTRINHVIDGADFGWRTGSGKFMDTCSDTFGAAVDIGLGSPTGVTFGHGAKFPARYQNALFACDWSYGKLYAVHLKPDGSSYTGSFEEFASAQPLPVADVLINPGDGAMYLLLGGRRVQSGLYRVTYTGAEPTAPAIADASGQAMRNQRKALEKHLQKGARKVSPKQLDAIWKALGTPDRGIRHAARVALEKQPADKWKARLTAEQNPWVATAAMMALARVDGKESGRLIQEKIMQVDFRGIYNLQLRLDYLRALTLSLTREGMPTPHFGLDLIVWLDGIYPADTPQENRDLSAIMQALQAPSAAKKGMALLTQASGQEEQIGYALNLRRLRQGWTPALREQYFEWFVLAAGYQGGARFRNYLDDIKKQAVAAIPEDQLTPKLQAIIDTKPEPTGPQFTFKPRSFVKNWALADLKPALDAEFARDRDFKNGRQMFGAGGCYACHRFNNEGGAVGPDLSSASGKFSAHDLLESIIDPGKEISDQYGSSIFTFKDGSQLVGRIMNMRAPDYWINTDMMTPSTVTKVKSDTIVSIEASPVSMMPPGLINSMTQADVLDLLAYLLSGGDREHRLFD